MKDRFEGRASRREWWKTFISLLLVGIFAIYLVGLMEGAYRGIDVAYEFTPQNFPITNAFGLLLRIVATLFVVAVSARRFHDLGRSGWWAALLFVPIIGSIVIIIWCGLFPGVTGPNSYGPDPIEPPKKNKILSDFEWSAQRSKRNFLVFGAIFGVLLIVALIAAYVQQPQIEPSWQIEEGTAAYDRGDYATALRHLGPLAKQGNAEAQYSLGVMYDKGEGVPKDFAEAASWYRKAAEQGDAQAQSKLGLMYYAGKGVALNHVTAHMWFNLSAAQGNMVASKLSEIVARKMTSAQIAEAQRLAREWKPKK